MSNLAGKLSSRHLCLIQGSLIRVMCVHLCLKAGNQLQMLSSTGAMGWSDGIAMVQGAAEAVPCSLPAPLSLAPETLFFCILQQLPPWFCTRVQHRTIAKFPERSINALCIFKCVNMISVATLRDAKQ